MYIWWFSQQFDVYTALSLFRKICTKILAFLFLNYYFFILFSLFLILCFFNNKGYLQLNLYGISNFLSFKIIFFLVSQLRDQPFCITVLHFTSHFTTSWLCSLHFMFYQHPQFLQFYFFMIWWHLLFHDIMNINWPKNYF